MRAQVFSSARRCPWRGCRIQAFCHGLDGPQGRAGKGDFAGALSSHSSEKYVGCTLKPEMFIAALIIIAKTQRQPRRPSVGEWINKLWYIQTINVLFIAKKK